MKIIQRLKHFNHIQQSLREHRVTALVGPRQCGKTWLSRQMATHYFDADSPLDQARLQSNALNVLSVLEGVVVIDEVQQMPELFPVLRVLADDPIPKRTFLLTGSASPELMGHAADRLAGRVHFIELGGFDLTETGRYERDKLWLRGGLPLSFLAESEAFSIEWRENFVKTYLQRDLRTIAESRLTPLQVYRFLGMLAHSHGQLKHQADLAKSLGIDVKTIRRHLDIFSGAYILRQLPAFSENMGKRVTKTPKVYFRDTGLLHTILGINSLEELSANPVYGVSWEGFGIEQIIRILDTKEEKCFYWRTQAGAELDLLLDQDKERLGFEFKRTDSPSTTKSMHIAMEDLKLRHLFVVYPGNKTFPLAQGLTAIAFEDLVQLPEMIEKIP